MIDFDRYVSDRVEFSNGLYFHPDVWDKNDRLLEADKFVKYGGFMLVFTVSIALLTVAIYTVSVWGISQFIDMEFAPNYGIVFGAVMGIILGWSLCLSVIVSKYKTLVKAVSP